MNLQVVVSIPQETYASHLGLWRRSGRFRGLPRAPSSACARLSCRDPRDTDSDRRAGSLCSVRFWACSPTWCRPRLESSAMIGGFHSQVCRPAAKHSFSLSPRAHLPRCNRSWRRLCSGTSAAFRLRMQERDFGRDGLSCVQQDLRIFPLL